MNNYSIYLIKKLLVFSLIEMYSLEKCFQNYFFQKYPGFASTKLYNYFKASVYNFFISLKFIQLQLLNLQFSVNFQ